MAFAPLIGAVVSSYIVLAINDFAGMQRHGVYTGIFKLKLKFLNILCTDYQIGNQ